MDQALGEHVTALAFNFVLEELWVAIRPHHNGGGTRQQVNAMVNWLGWW
jgi:hypothetical protein